MKQFLLLLALPMCIFFASCQKEQTIDKPIDKPQYCRCGDPKPLSSDGHIPDISWTDYNSVQDVCFHFERMVRFIDIINGKLREYHLLDHVGDTLKVYGWLYDAKGTRVDPMGKWIAHDPKFTSGLEKYPPWNDGEGFRLRKLQVTDSSLIKNKCFVTGTIRFSSDYTILGDYGELDACEPLRIELNVIDIYFEEDEK